jgi:hypothetical protein
VVKAPLDKGLERMVVRSADKLAYSTTSAAPQALLEQLFMVANNINMRLASEPAVMRETLLSGNHSA